MLEHKYKYFSEIIALVGHSHMPFLDVCMAVDKPPDMHV